MSATWDGRRCRVPGCQGTAKPGYSHCERHLFTRGGSGDVDLIPNLIHRITEAAQGDSLEDIEVIAREMRTLYAAREAFVAWVEQKLRDEEKREKVPPSRFLRAWSESTARVIQLLRARHELCGGEAGSLDALIDTVHQRLEEVLAAEQDAEDE
jgi:hypothetical protein